MGKGNMLLGYTRGSIGDVVMSRVKAQQIVKARNRQPANPKTKSQMKQRATFIAPVKFYSHGRQALFKFAYSDKRAKESDFNAFMRNNSKASFPITKSERESTGFPALGNYMMAKGKLPEVPVALLEENTNRVVLAVEFSAELTTIAQLSAAIVAAGVAAEGDILTFVGIHEEVAYITNNELIVGEGNAPVWTLNQFFVDSSNPATINDAMPDMRWHEFGGKYYLSFQPAVSDAYTNIFAMSVICSRKTAYGLEVSNAFIKNGGYVDAYINYRNQPDQIARVIADWGATGDAILQGSIALR